MRSVVGAAAVAVDVADLQRLAERVAATRLRSKVSPPEEQVGAGAERAAGAGDDDDPHGVVGIGLVEQRARARAHLRVVGVELVGPVRA